MTTNDKIDMWITYGHDILEREYWGRWDEIVPIRLDDLYHGMELGCCLEIINSLNGGCALSHAKEIMENQNHSGLSWTLVRDMVRDFCDRGWEFDSYLTEEEK